MPNSGWEGIGWFRLHITIDSTLFNKPLGLGIRQAGVSEIYLDGTLIYTFGILSLEDTTTINNWTAVPKVISFDRKKSYVIAVR